MINKRELLQLAMAEIKINTIKSIIKYNLDTLVDIFDENSLLEKISLQININMVRLCHANPEEQQYFRKLSNIEKEIHSFLSTTKRLFLNRKSVKNLSLLKFPVVDRNDYSTSNDLFSVQYKILPIINVSESKKCISYITYCTENNNQMQIYNYNTKSLESLEGYVSKIDEVKNEIIKYYICNNQECPNQITRIVFASKILEYLINDKIIIEKEVNNNHCSSCKCPIELYKYYLKYKYHYLINANNILITASSDIDIPCSPETLTLFGYFEKNDKGFTSFKIVNWFKKIRKINFREIKNYGIKNIEKYLSTLTKDIINNNITKDDKSLLIILNIFNTRRKDWDETCEFYGNIKSNSAVLCTPEESFEQVKENIRMIIYTNDVNYIKYFAKTVLNHIKIIFMPDKFTSDEDALLITSSTGKLKEKHLKYVTHEFAVDIENEFSYSYSRKEVCFYSIKQYYDNQLQEIIQKTFIELREKFKGIITPEKLLKTIKSLFVSINSLVQGNFEKNDIKNIFYAYCYKKII